MRKSEEEEKKSFSFMKKPLNQWMILFCIQSISVYLLYQLDKSSSIHRPKAVVYTSLTNYNNTKGLLKICRIDINLVRKNIGDFFFSL